MHCAHTLDQGSAEPRQATARPGRGRRGSGSGRLWERRHWGRARLYQWSTMGWSGDGRWYGHSRGRSSGARARDGSGDGGTEAGRSYCSRQGRLGGKEKME